MKENLTIKVTADLSETTMNGDHITAQAGMTAVVIILMGITAHLTETVRVVLVRMTTVKVVVITADLLTTTATTIGVVTATTVKADTTVLLMATIAPLMVTMIVLMETTIVRMVAAAVSTVLLVLTMTKDRAEPILLLRKGMLQATA